MLTTAGRLGAAFWLCLALAAPARADLFISELMASNDSTVTDEDGDFSDWVEVHNTGPGAADLASYYLTDDASDPTKWQFPSTVLAAGGYLVVFASDKDRTVSGSELHTSFKLSAAGEYLALVEPDGVTIAHEYADGYGPQTPDVSHGLSSDLVTERCFLDPTPGSPNDESPPCGRTEAPAFSTERGFYDSPFAVTLTTTTPGAGIKYTLDGTDPAAPGALTYSSPIAVSTTTLLRAVATRVDLQPSVSVTHSYIFIDDVLEQDANAGPQTWNSDYAMDPDVIDDPLYAGVIEDSLTAIPTISVVMDMDDLFGATTGIYTHAGQHGDEWERPASAELIRTDGVEGFQINCGIRIQGDLSRALNKKKSFRLAFKSIYGPGELDYPFFAGSPVKVFDKIRLRAGNEKTWAYASRRSTYVADQWARDTQLAMGRPSSRGNWVHLYLNGLYWGLYNTVERPDHDFAAAHLGGDPEDWDVIKNGNEQINGDDVAWDAAHALANAGVQTPGAYAALRQLVDVPNLIDYFLMNFWMGTRDWDHNNWYVARKREPGAGFQFLSWDTEISLESVRDSQVDIDNSNNPSNLYTALRQNEEFRVLFGDHAHRHMFNGGVLTEASAWSRFATRLDEIRTAIVAESARWGDTITSAPLTRDRDWLTETERLRLAYFPQRTAFILDELREADLYPDVVAPTFSRHGGLFDGSIAVTMSAPAGVIHYTLDGSDPRLTGGALSPSAMQYTAPVPLSASMRVRARALAGGQWSALNDAQFTRDTHLRITELMFHPADPPVGDPTPDDDFEFVELTNVGASSVDLDGVEFTEGIALTFGPGMLAPGAHVLIVRNQAAFESRYGLGHPIAGTYTGRLDNSGERLVVVAADGSVVHDFTYVDEWYPAADGPGRSLVVRDATAEPDAWQRKDGWRASTFDGGSPGDAEAAACSNGLDDDLDGATDHPADDGCATAAHDGEDPECDDGEDNDGDSLVDTADGQCADASGTSEAAAPIGAFVCYGTRLNAAASFDAQSVLVDDALVGARPSLLRKPRALCLPAEVDGQPILDPTVHLQIYDLSDESGITHVTISGMFFEALGPIFADLKKPGRLLVPAAMDTGAPIGALNDAAHAADRYKCYGASVTKTAPKYFPSGVRLRAVDELEDRIYYLKKPSRVCLPAEVDGGAIKNVLGGLICYGAKRDRDQPSHAGTFGVHSTDDFGSLIQDTRDVSEICVPLR